MGDQPFEKNDLLDARAFRKRAVQVMNKNSPTTKMVSTYYKDGNGTDISPLGDESMFSLMDKTQEGFLSSKSPGKQMVNFQGAVMAGVAGLFDQIKGLPGVDAFFPDGALDEIAAYAPLAGSSPDLFSEDVPLSTENRGDFLAGTLPGFIPGNAVPSTKGAPEVSSLTPTGHPLLCEISLASMA